MTVKTTLSFTDRHHKFMIKQVEDGIYATQSSLVADAIEQLIRQEERREASIQAMADEIRRRLQTPREEYVDEEAAFGPARDLIERVKSS